MGLRLRQTLPADQLDAMDALTLRQLIGLRFAADAELPDLVRRTLEENLEEQAIKKLVTDWQGLRPGLQLAAPGCL